MRLAWIFLRRDWLRWSSYRLSAAGQLGGIVLFLVVIGYLGGVIGDASLLRSGGGGYVAFVMAGLAFMDLYLTSLFAFPGAVRDAQVDGTLEPTLLTPVRIPELVLASSLFPYVRSALRILMIAIFGVGVMGFWRHANLASIAIVTVPACVGFLATGLVSASFVLVFKMGDPIISAYTRASWLLGGAVLPIAALPGFLQVIGWLLPVSHALAAGRAALEGAPPTAVMQDAAILTAVAVAITPPALVLFSLALRHAKRAGSLVQY